MKVTIKDVAQRAGVSIATVSRVFNGYTDISDSTKEKVMRIAEEMDYIPNFAARALSSKTQTNIALILNDMELNKKSNLPMDILSGVYQFAEDEGFEFFLLPITSTKQKEKSLKNFFYEKNIAGAVIQGLKIDDPYYNEVFTSQLPVVLIDMNADESHIGSASIDSIRASTEAVEYLIKEGHRCIAMINGRRNATVTIEREAGYIKGLNKHNLEVKQDYIQYANFSEEIAYAMAFDVLLNNPEITAFFCASDIMAIGVIKAVQKLGLQIPKDISIIGFDDILLAKHLSPSLSSVAQNMKKLGYDAAELLASLILKKDMDSYHIFVPHKLKIRESVGPVRKIN